MRRDYQRRLSRLEAGARRAQGVWTNREGGVVHFLPAMVPWDEDGTAMKDAVAAYEREHGPVGPHDIFLLRPEPMTETEFEALHDVRPADG